MRKDRLYLLTFISLAVVFFIISTVAVRYFVDEAADKILETQLESSKREAKQVAVLVENQLQNGITKDKAINSIQASIENSNLDAGFISVFDWSGKVICHPDVKRIGRISSKKTFVSSVSDEITSDDLYKLLQQNETTNSETDTTETDNSEVIFIYPITNSDWIVGAHINTQKIAKQITTLRNNFLIILLIMGFLFILSALIIIRLLGSKYEKKLEIKNEKLSDEIINLSKLNRAVDSYQQKVIEKPQNSENDTNEDGDDDENSITKKRILTYIRNELLTITTQDIAYVYTDTGITYVMCYDGKRSISNSSLDELFANLDTTYFFRANRQFIISISAIDKIVKYGNNQLKILINPNSEVDIIISKNKAAEFKKWLNL